MRRPFSVLLQPAQERKPMIFLFLSSIFVTPLFAFFSARWENSRFLRNKVPLYLNRYHSQGMALAEYPKSSLVFFLYAHEPQAGSKRGEMQSRGNTWQSAHWPAHVRPWLSSPICSAVEQAFLELGHACRRPQQRRDNRMDTFGSHFTFRRSRCSQRDVSWLSASSCSLVNKGSGS